MTPELFRNNDDVQFLECLLRDAKKNGIVQNWSTLHASDSCFQNIVANVLNLGTTVSLTRWIWMEQNGLMC